MKSKEIYETNEVSIIINGVRYDAVKMELTKRNYSRGLRFEISKNGFYN